MNQNMLKLNDGKTELIVFTSKYKQDVYNDLSITIGDTVVDCSSQVKHSQNKEVHTTGHKCRPCQVISNVETGLLKWFVLWTPQLHCFWIASGSKAVTLVAS